jgi:hypothetical protein
MKQESRQRDRETDDREAKNFNLKSVPETEESRQMSHAGSNIDKM